MNNKNFQLRFSAYLTVTALLTATCLAACGPTITDGSESGNTSSAPNKLTAPDRDTASGEITIWDRSGDLFEVFDSTIQRFNEKYPDIVVHHEAIDIDSKLQDTLITQTDVPDGVFLDDAKVGGFKDSLWDVSELLKPYEKDIAPQKLDVNRVGDGIYGIPFDLDPGLLLYNETALRNAGIDPDAIQTYDDLLAAARAYKEFKPDSGPIHLEKSPFLAQLQLEMYASQLGTSLASEDGSLRLDSPEYVKVLNFLNTVNNEGLGTRAEYLDPTDIAELESANEVFYPWAIWFSFAPEQLLQDTHGSWRAMALPSWEDNGARSGAMGGSSFVLPKDGENSQLAWLFYEFLMFDENGYASVWGPNDVYPSGLMTSVPAYKPAADPETPLFKPSEALGNQDLWKIATKAGAEIPGGTPIPTWFAGAVDYLGNDLQRMFDGELSPDEVIENSTAEIQTNLVDRQ